MSKKILGSIIVILIIAVGFYYQSQLSDDDGVKKVGFIYVGPVTDFGWTYEHDQGRKAVVEAFGEAVETTYGKRPLPYIHNIFWVYESNHQSCGEI